MSGLSPASYQSQITASVSGRTLTVNQVCPDGTGSLIGAGSGGSASWSGELVCPPVDVFSDCHAVTMTYRSGTISLNSGSISAALTGEASGCGVTRTATTSFSGAKQ